MIISLLIAVCVIAFLYWAVTSILTAFGIGDPIQTIVRVLVVVLLVVVVLRALGLMPNLLT